MSPRVYDAAVNEVDPKDATFENAILPIIYDENARSKESQILRFYASTSPFERLRDAS
jgi:metallopeptidase MepB